MLSMTLVGMRELSASIAALPAKVHAALLNKVTVLALELESKIREDKLSGQVLRVRTGALRSSIQSRVEDQGHFVIATAFSCGEVNYAAIHEFGGKTPAHDIVATKSKALSFIAGGSRVFATTVNHPGSQMPERSFLRSALADMHENILSGLTEAVREAVRSQ